VRATTVQTYISVTRDQKCWETRGLSVPDQFLVAKGEYRHRDRDLTQWLNNWEPIARLTADAQELTRRNGERAVNKGSHEAARGSHSP